MLIWTIKWREVTKSSSYGLLSYKYGDAILPVAYFYVIIIFNDNY